MIQFDDLTAAYYRRFKTHRSNPPTGVIYGLSWEGHIAAEIISDDGEFPRAVNRGPAKGQLYDGSPDEAIDALLADEETIGFAVDHPQVVDHLETTGTFSDTQSRGAPTHYKKGEREYFIL